MGNKGEYSKIRLILFTIIGVIIGIFIISTVGRSNLLYLGIIFVPVAVYLGGVALVYGTLKFIFTCIHKSHEITDKKFEALRIAMEQKDWDTYNELKRKL
ncbi:MAG: hypothetical protein PHD71_08520 [Methanospirillum sp.]|nr:hypothetical protein [Methanospirillum sp.]